MRTVHAPTRPDIEAAVRLPPTPVVESDGFGLKLETLQPTGSFKVRGALNALSKLDGPVVTASAGNFRPAVAWGAGRLRPAAARAPGRSAPPAHGHALRPGSGARPAYGG